MDLSVYLDITGKSIPVSQEKAYEAAIRRATAILESMLGYTLDPDRVNENLYNETGKTNSDCFCLDINEENLLPPDEVVNAYRLYRYNPEDKYLHIDPFTVVHAVKLVKDDVTIKTFDVDRLRVQQARFGVNRFIERCKDCGCECDCTNCVQLAVDADWLWPMGSEEPGYPDDLLTVWAEMVSTEYDCKKDIKQETIGAHSYTRFSKTEAQKMDGSVVGSQKWAKNILLRYVGPWGTLNKIVGP